MGDLDRANGLADDRDDSQPPTETKPRYTEDEIDHLLGLLERTAPDWSGSIDGQAEACVYLQRVWKWSIDRHRERAWAIVRPHLRRLRFHPQAPRVAFEMLMQLPNELDVRRAVEVNPHLYKDYQPDRDEWIYTEVGGWLGRYMEYVRYNQVPLAFHFWSGVMALSAAARRNVYFQHVGDETFLNQFIFLVGPKASGKSIAMKRGVDVLKRMNRQIGDDHKWAHVHLMAEDSTQEGLLKDLEEINQIPRRDPRGWEVPESEGEACFILALDELAVQFGENTWAVGKKAPFYVQIYGNPDYTKSTVRDRKVDIKNICPNIFGCAAPEWFKEVITPHILKGGMVDRTLYIYRQGSQRSYDPLSVPTPDPILAEQLASELLRWSMPKTDVKKRAWFDSEVKEWIQDTYSDERREEIETLSFGDQGPKRASLVRSYLQILKLGVVLSLSDESFPLVTLHQVQLARELLYAEDRWYDKFMNIIRRKEDAEVYDVLEAYFRESGWEVYHADLIQRFKKSIGPRKVIMRYVATLLDDETLVKDMTGVKLKYVWTQRDSGRSMPRPRGGLKLVKSELKDET